VSIFDINTGLIHLDTAPGTLESSFDNEGKAITVKFVKQDRAGIESTYIDDSPCKKCSSRSTCQDECGDFERYVDPAKYSRKMKKLGANHG